MAATSTPSPTVAGDDDHAAYSPNSKKITERRPHGQVDFNDDIFTMRPNSAHQRSITNTADRDEDDPNWGPKPG
jgi:hypothetical protein